MLADTKLMIWNETSTMSCSYDIPEMHELKSRAYRPSLDAHDHGSTGGRATATVATDAVFLALINSINLRNDI